MVIPVCRELVISENNMLSEESFRDLRISMPGAPEWKPGQFVMLRPEGWVNEPLWPRPFSIADLNGGHLRIILQVVGKGTKLLAGLKPMDRITVWGPLGNGFDYDPETRLLLLAGGIGVAPFLGLARRHPHPEKLKLVFGRRFSDKCYPLAEIASRIEVRDFLQKDEHDLQRFIGLLRREISGFAGKGLILACGPGPFLKTVRDLSLEYGATAQLSLENRMACGIGACLGCVTKNKDDKFVQVCTDGPVFDAGSVKL